MSGPNTNQKHYILRGLTLEHIELLHIKISIKLIRYLSKWSNHNSTDFSILEMTAFQPRHVASIPLHSFILSPMPPNASNEEFLAQKKARKLRGHCKRAGRRHKSKGHKKKKRAESAGSAAGLAFRSPRATRRKRSTKKRRRSGLVGLCRGRPTRTMAMGYRPTSWPWS